jgi:hypothetical protein
MTGHSIRLAVSLGLHLRNEDSSASLSKKEALLRIWWSLYSIECLVCTITGRLPAISTEDCTVSLPGTLSDEQNEYSSTTRQGFRKRTAHGLPRTFGSSSPSRVAMQSTTEGCCFLGHIKIAIITQKVLTSLYSPRTAVQSWKVRLNIGGSLCLYRRRIT